MVGSYHRAYRWSTNVTYAISIERSDKTMNGFHTVVEAPNEIEASMLKHGSEQHMLQSQCEHPSRRLVDRRSCPCGNGLWYPTPERPIPAITTQPQQSDRGNA